VSCEHPFTNGWVHTKVEMPDDSLVFLTGANLTVHALEMNMEADFLVGQKSI
jgi:phosphatidylserine/phosphatidylglycerophosphate/cardiolipin synthase-like enzyme